MQIAFIEPKYTLNKIEKTICNNKIDFIEPKPDYNKTKADFIALDPWQDMKNCYIAPKLQPINPNRLDRGQMLDETGQIFNRGTTNFCRDDIDWKDFGKYLKENFENLSDVDIYCFGCSTGEEAYSLAMLLKKYFDDEDFVINASDIVSDRVEKDIAQQKSGIIVDENNFLRIVQSLDLSPNQIKKYFLPNGSTSVKLSSDVVDCVTFEQNNILNSIGRINQNKKSIVMCRNMWPYIKPEEYNGFAQELYSKLKTGSVVVIGSYDCMGECGIEFSDAFPMALLQCGFRPIRGGQGILSRELDARLIYQKD